MNIKYITMPIYSVAIYNEYVYFSGGGGGKTGIPNEIHIYHRQITKEPLSKISTSCHIIENMTIFADSQVMACNANGDVVIYRLTDGGANIHEMYRFKADFASANSTIDSICFSGDGMNIATGGEDMTVRFFQLLKDGSNLVHEYSLHSHQIKNIDHNQKDLYLSSDNHQIIIYNYPKKSIQKILYADQLKPQKSLFQSSYFIASNTDHLIITHFIFKQATYVTRDYGNKLKTKQIAQDQSCKTAFDVTAGYLGVACGNGVSLMVDINGLDVVSRQTAHKFVITDCKFNAKTHRMLSGTPECSYHIQTADPPLLPFSVDWSIFLALAVTFLVLYLLGSSNNPSTLQL